MQESNLQAQLSESKAEITKRKERLFRSIISLAPKLSGSESAIPLEKFLENIANTATNRTVASVRLFEISSVGRC